MFATTIKRSTFATFGGLGAIGAAVALGVLPETKRGLTAGLLYPYGRLYKNSRENFFYRLGISGFGFISGMGLALKASPSLNPFVSTPTVLFGSACGIVTAKLCFEYHHYPIVLGTMSAKIITYGLDGLVADIVGRPEGQVSRWEEDGISLESLLEARNDDEAHVLKTMKTTSMVEDAWKDGTLIKSEKSLKYHKQLLIRKMVDLREQERIHLQNKVDAEDLIRLIKLRNVPEYDGVKKRLEDISINLQDISKKKMEIKNRCLRIHGISLSKAIVADVAIAGTTLTEYRRTQLALAHDYLAADSNAEKSQLRAKIKQIDMKKLILKEKILKDHHVKLARHESAKRVESHLKYLRQ